MVLTEEQQKFLIKNQYLVIDDFISDKDCDAIKDYIESRIEEDDYNIKLSVDIQESLDKYTEGKFNLEFHGKRPFIEEKIKKHFKLENFDDLYDTFEGEYSFMYYYDIWKIEYDPDDSRLFDFSDAAINVRRKVTEIYKECVNNDFDNLHILRRLQIYPPGGHISEHTDGGDGVYSFSISVGDKEGEGGVLRCNGEDIENKKGRCVIMNADSNIHEVTPTIGWSRYNYIVFAREHE
jgi:hypothetical protein|tara:strand:+ start:899 stop:1606 length:708 start_codon:yes stop_codon:yes gene_type:complete